MRTIVASTHAHSLNRMEDDFVIERAALPSDKQDDTHAWRMARPIRVRVARAIGVASTTFVVMSLSTAHTGK